jgi:hypothetical protein
MAIFELTIDTPFPAFETRAGAVAYIIQSVQVALNELGRNQGTVLTGSIYGSTPSGENSNLGSWTYSPGG